MRDKSLTVFTILSQMAVGAVWGTMFFPTHVNSHREIAVGIFFSAAAGLLAAFFHLGKPLRGWRALTNIRSSWLSREILFASLFAGASAAVVGLEWFDFGLPIMSRTMFWMMAFLGLGLIYSMSKAYQLRTIPAWDTRLTAVSFIITAFLLGILMVVLFSPVLLEQTAVWVMLLLAVQIVLIYVWVVRLSKGKAAARTTVERLTQQHRMIFWLRIGFGFSGIIGVGVFLLENSTATAAIIFGLVFLSELLGRMLFYTARVRYGV
jgi:anaerobic dimethyl sulfoxide reductase subunit C (anchor subunit)